MKGDTDGPNVLPHVYKTSNTNLKDESEFLGEDTADIQLTSHNYAKGYLDNNESVVLLIDSGATSSLISGTCIQRSPLLSKLPQFDIEPRRFKIGNGEYLCTNKAISFEINIQKQKFKIHACIADNLAGPDMLLGATTLAALNGSLDFRTHTFTVRPS